MKKNLEVIKKLSEYNYNKVVSVQKQRENVTLEETRGGQQTIKVADPDSGREVYLHSKYDPVREAEKFIEGQAEYIEEHPHVLFFGVGLGYHVEAFKSKYPDKFWSIYEPDTEVFHKFMKVADFSKFFNWKFKYMNIEVNDGDRKSFLTSFADLIHDGLAIVTLPSYENIYSDAKDKFDRDFIDKIKNRKQSVMVEVAFAKRWVINSLMNLPYTFTSENMLTDYAEKFRNKPIVIVSAGPSLQFEYHNLRRIKEEGLAYIFAVGSANRALINNDIYPDLVTSYDPQAHNYMVYQPIIDKQLDSIPMAYGTSVGFETMMEYPGKLIHMITSQDTVSPYYLKRLDGQELEFINDAPTIAVVTLQLAIKMQASKIYLVGQNLAFLEDLRYAESVHEKNQELVKKSDTDLKTEESVIDVDGNEIGSSFGFNKMREEMEAYIKHYKADNIYNTTKGGAAIEGAPFVSLNDVVKDKLETEEVDGDWFGSDNQQIYDYKYLLKRIGEMDYSIRRGRRQLKEICDLLEEIERNHKRANAKNLRRLLTDFDKALDRFQKSDIWKVYIERIVRVYTETINKKSHELIATDDFVERARVFGEIFPPYIMQMKLVLEELAPVIKDVHMKLERLVLGKDLNINLEEKLDINEKKSGKLYTSDSRIIKYEGDWQQHNYLPTSSDLYELTEMFTNEKEAKVSFRFTGSSLKIYTSTREDRSADIEVSINGETHKVSQKDTRISMSEIPDIWYAIFSIDGLEDKRNGGIEDSHLVEMKLQDSTIMSIIGVEVDDKAILIHPDEVSSVDELEIGKRIRCHYKAEAGQVGVFSKPGDASVMDVVENLSYKDICIENFLTNHNPDNRDFFLSPASSATPNGYFYFIMVDYDENGRKMLIADRNIQHSISWNTLNDAGLVMGNNVDIDGIGICCRLIDGGQAFGKENEDISYKVTRLGAYPKNNEYDVYIKRNGVDSLLGRKQNIMWHYDRIYSWCYTQPLDGNYNDLGGKETVVDKSKKNRVVVRGNHEHDLWASMLFQEPNKQNNTIGFRPVMLV